MGRLARAAHAVAAGTQAHVPTVAYAAKVTRDAASAAELVAVALQNTEDQGQLASEQAPWPARTDSSLPQRGDECLVVLDDTGRPWVVAWNEPGW